MTDAQKKNNASLAFLAGLIIGILLLIVILFFSHGNSLGFFGGNKVDTVEIYKTDTVQSQISFTPSLNAVYGWEHPKKGNSSIQIFRRNHKNVDSTYYIDSSGFKQLLDAPNSLLKIDLGCNGIENPAEHKYHLLFSGYDTSGKGRQFFAKLPSTVRVDGLNTGDDAYLDKTCPCPHGNSCICTELKKQ